MVVQKSKTFRTSWANTVKVCRDDGSRKRETEASEMVYQETFGRLDDEKSLGACEDTEEYGSRLVESLPMERRGGAGRRVQETA